MRRTRAGVLIVLIAAVFLAGCPWDVDKKPPKPDPSIYLPQISPRNCLENLKIAYVDQDLDEYKKLFSTDFTFWFSPEDIGNPEDPTPQTWGASEDQLSTQNLFEDELVERITLEWTLHEASPSDDEYPGTWKAEVTEVRLSVFTRDEEGRPLELRVPGGYATFFFKEYPQELIDGKSTWRIFRWEDQPLGGGLARLIAGRT
jgi:hypothetical protein